MINFIVDIIIRISTALSLMFKKPAQVIPPTKETEKVVVQRQQDNYYTETMEKTYRQHQYEQSGRADNNQYPYLNWEQTLKNRK